MGAETTPDAKRLYQEFEALNTPDNLGVRFIGGQPPDFIKQQTQLLHAIGARPSEDAIPILLRMATEHLERIEELGAAKFRRSPLQAVQVPLVDALGAHAISDDICAALARFAKSPLVKEYARGRALDVLVERQLSRIGDPDDPNGEKRAKLLLDSLIGGLTLSEVLHAPGRLRALARRVPAIPKAEPATPWRALAAAAASPAQRYAADAALAIVSVQKENAGTPFSLGEKDLLVEAANHWLKEFRPAAAKEKYPSDLLEECILRLGARLDHEPLAKPLRDAGLIPPAHK
jgi:hypothetical protein